MKAMFDNVKAFAVFSSKPHLFRVGQPYQMGNSNVDGCVFVNLVAGNPKMFAKRVSQFGGVVLGGA